MRTIPDHQKAADCSMLHPRNWVSNFAKSERFLMLVGCHHHTRLLTQCSFCCQLLHYNFRKQATTLHHHQKTVQNGQEDTISQFYCRTGIAKRCTVTTLKHLIVVVSGISLSLNFGCERSSGHRPNFNRAEEI